MSAYDSLPDGVTEIFGAESTAEEAYGLLTVDVPAGSWIAALETARDKLGCTYFDWLSAVDEPGTGFRVCAHVVALGDGRVRRLLVRTTVPHAAPVLPSAVDVYAGAAWHERETHEMFGVDFTDHPHLVPLLLPDSFEGHPLRKDFVLAARVAKAWPGAKEPGESEHGGPKRRQMLPPGVPDPNEWGPLKGQLPPAPARPARTPRAAGAAADRPPRRTRSVSEGSASQPTPAAPETVAPSEGAPEAPAVRPRRTRSASEGSASQQAGAVAGEPAAPPRTRSSDAPWHNPKPAFTEETPEQAQAETPADDKPEAAPTRESAPAPERAEVQEPTRAPEQTAEPTPADASPPAHEPTQADASTPAEDPSRAEDPTPAQAPPAREPASGDEGPDASGPAESTRPAESTGPAGGDAAESTDPAGGDPRE
ncbi:NADH-quinone oxidoreductase subunit C [Streptomyces sp. NPDC001205]